MFQSKKEPHTSSKVASRHKTPRQSGLRTPTGGELGGLPFAQRVLLLCVQCGRVLGVGRQVEQRVLGEASRQAQLLGVGALDGEEESVAGDFGPWRKPRHDGAVLGDVAEVDVCRSVGLCRDVRRCQSRSQKSQATFWKPGRTSTALTCCLLSDER